MEKEKRQRYSFRNVRRHTAWIREQFSSSLVEHLPIIEQYFNDFDNYITDLESQPRSLERNVRLMLACKLFNHIYSGLILTEAGLIVDAISCERNALETIAFHWLICLDPNVATKYEQGIIPRPVEVRKKLEKLGVDIKTLKSLYTKYSQIAHVGRESEFFHSKWTTPEKGQLLIGGAFDREIQSEFFEVLLVLLQLFYCPKMVDKNAGS